MKFADKYIYEPSAPGYKHVWKPVWIEDGEERTCVYPASTNLDDLKAYMSQYGDAWELYYEDDEPGTFMRWYFGWNTPAQEYFRKLWPTIDVGC